MKRTRSLVTPLSFIKLPDSINSGIAKSGKEVVPEKVVWTRNVKDNLSFNKVYTMLDPTRVTATGIPNTKRRTKVSKKIVIKVIPPSLVDHSNWICAT